jgi:hypothetical protein
MKKALTGTRKSGREGFHWPSRVKPPPVTNEVDVRMIKKLASPGVEHLDTRRLADSL